MSRDWFSLECSGCSTRFYRSSRKKNAQTKLEISKFCPNCRKHTKHVEKKK